MSHHRCDRQRASRDRARPPGGGRPVEPTAPRPRVAPHIRPLVASPSLPTVHGTTQSQGGRKGTGPAAQRPGKSRDHASEPELKCQRLTIGSLKTRNFADPSGPHDAGSKPATSRWCQLRPITTSIRFCGLWDPRGEDGWTCEAVMRICTAAWRRMPENTHERDFGPYGPLVLCRRMFQRSIT